MTEQYSVSKYLSRIEAAHLDILESKVPTDKTITLWWGLDGLKLNEDGTMELVSRKKKRTSESAPYQPCHGQIAQMINGLQQCCVQYQAQYPPYYYGGCCGSYIG